MLTDSRCRVSGTLFLSLAGWCCIGLSLFAQSPVPRVMEVIRVSDDKTHFVKATSLERFVIWGVNYDHDSDGRLLDEYWIDEWDTVVEDFQEMKELGANCIRVHLQFGKFMETPDQPNESALRQLAKLVELAEATGLYLDITGLACYHKKNIPAWYDELNETERWNAQAAFWRAIAKTCASSPAVFCYDLMNEPILPGKDPETDWLAGDLAGKYFVQRISLDAKGRERKELAAAWVKQLTSAIREHDSTHLVTVGVIPWVFVFGGGEPLFHSPEVGGPLDFVAVHFYPETDKIDEAITALKKYDIGKPLIIEEMFPLKADIPSIEDFVKRSSEHADGWISFYWGTTAGTLLTIDKPTLAESITGTWLAKFTSMSDSVKTGK